MLSFISPRDLTAQIAILIFCLVFTHAVSANDKTTINFAPLPTKNATKNIKDFLSLNSYLEENLSININYIYKKDYKDILDGFKNQTIDLAYLGPLPLILLNKQYQYVQPIVAFNNKNNTNKYRCVIAKFKTDNFDKSKPIKVALTQPLSTCGYLMTSKLLKEQFDIDLAQQQFQYTMSHTNALLSVVKGEFLLAGAKDSIAKQFASLGMEIIAQSDLLPGFSLVANKKTLSQKQINDIRDSLLSITKETYSQWNGIASNGMTKITIKDYDSLNIDIDIPQQGNIK